MDGTRGGSLDIFKTGFEKDKDCQRCCIGNNMILKNRVGRNRFKETKLQNFEFRLR